MSNETAQNTEVGGANRFLFESLEGREEEARQMLEQPNWAPWLAFSTSQFKTQVRTFPEGQFLLCDDSSTPLAMLSTNRIFWDGEPSSLTSWDQIAGENRSFDDTFVSDGNTLVLLSISIRTDQQGKNLTSVLIDHAKELAKSSGITHVISDFRPSNYGKYKAENGDPGFAKYSELKRDSDGLPLDQWLRSLARNNMVPLKNDNSAMVVSVNNAEFSYYKANYKPDKWYQVTDEAAIKSKLDEHKPGIDLANVEVWECEETGTWYLDVKTGDALYVETNLWGKIPT